jgi:hypothetical protein
MYLYRCTVRSGRRRWRFEVFAASAEDAQAYVERDHIPTIRDCNTDPKVTGVVMVPA